MADSTSKYWEKRAREREARWTEKCQREIEQEMARYYAAALREIEKDILALYARFAQDNALSMKDARKLLHGQEFRDWRMGMKDYLTEIKRLKDAGQISESQGLLRELNTLAMRSRITVLDKLRSETMRELDSLGRKTETAMEKFLGEAYKDAYYRSVFDIGKEGMFRGSFSKVDSKQVENVLRTPWSGKNYSERIWNDMKKLEGTIQDMVTQGVHRGLSVQKMTQKVMERMNVSRSNAERLVRTEMNYAQNQAALEGIKDAGMGYFRFVAVLDSRTTPICRGHDGEVFPVEEASPGSNVPPLHPRCRSTIIASLDDSEAGTKGGRRAARGSKGKTIGIPDEMKYSDWKAVYVDKSKTWSEWKQETGYKGKEMFTRFSSDFGIDVSSEYTDMATPGKGRINFQDGFRPNNHRNEVTMVNLLHETFGGDFVLLDERITPNTKTPDFMWDDKAWDLKTISTLNAVDNAIRSGLKQIVTDSGGLVLEFNMKESDLENVYARINNRMRRSVKKETDIIIVNNGQVVKVRRYTIKKNR